MNLTSRLRVIWVVLSLHVLAIQVVDGKRGGGVASHEQRAKKEHAVIETADITNEIPN